MATVIPSHFHMTPPINLTQANEYQHRAIDQEALEAEHQGALDAFRGRDVHVVELMPHPTMPYLLNVRDVAAVIGTRLISCRMQKTVRMTEPYWVHGQLVTNLGGPSDIWVTERGRIEGGDIFQIQGEVFIGLSQRSTQVGARSFCAKMSNPQLPHLVRLHPDVLHLDTVFNVVDSIAVIATDLIENVDYLVDSLQKLGITTVLDISTAEAGNMATNFVSICNRHVLSSNSAPDTSRRLAAAGVLVDTIDFAEHHRVGGSLRCMTLPLVRDTAVRGSDCVHD